MESNRYTNINISTVTLVKVILIGFLIYIMFLIRDILVVFFVSLVFAAAIGPLVDWMQKRKIPRTLGVIFIYLALLILFGSIIYLMIPPISEQVRDLSENFPDYINKIIKGYSFFSVQEGGTLESIKGALDAVRSGLETNAGNVFSTVTGVFGSIFSFFLTLVVTFYMAVEDNAMKKIVRSIIPFKHQPYALDLVGRMQKKIGLWLRGQLVLCFAVGLLVYIGLKILGIKYALVLALIAGITEFIPYLGPIMGAIPAVLIAFSVSPMLALVTAVFYYLVQFTENNVLVPKIMQKAVGLNPIVSIAVLLIGFQLAGIAGAILSIPVATAASVFIQDIFDHRMAEDN
ncbi:MAG: AI-2E family transporter [Patescibacteria group bacterium]|jgi:predicted PurR-regulated permease PerM